MALLQRASALLKQGNKTKMSSTGMRRDVEKKTEVEINKPHPETVPLRRSLASQGSIHLRPTRPHFANTYEVENDTVFMSCPRAVTTSRET